MKLTLILVLFIYINSFGQKYGNVWQFGKQTGIDFNFCSPVFLNNGKNAGTEGCSSISDSTGQLLFYTNSDSVWNKFNVVMPNGFLFNSTGTLSQVIIIPKPLSNSLYYIVTTQVQAQGSPALKYHVVDISLNGGLGDVISKNNILHNSNITEQITAARHSDGINIWLMAHEYGTNNFLAYLVTAAGISSTPVISSIGPSHASSLSNINARGEMKFSPNGTKIAFTGNGNGTNDSTNILALFDFDNNTGVVTNPINLPYSRGDYGLTFSPDNSKLYGATWKAGFFTVSDSNYLYQFDLSIGDSLTIINSRKVIYQQQERFGSLSIGPDGKIYVARPNKGYLGVVNFPNAIGIACDYNHNGFFLEGETCNYGLNNCIEYTNYCSTTKVLSYNDLTRNIVVLNQNVPNPFAEQTTISYYLPDNVSRAQIVFLDQTGKIIKAVDIIEKGKGQLNVFANDLSNGVYTYSIIVDGQTVETKKMLKAK